MAWLRQYFNINSTDFLKRLGCSLIPFYPNFSTMTEGSADLYGPFWIFSTLIFLVAAIGSLKGFFSTTDTTNFYQQFLPISAGIVNTF